MLFGVTSVVAQIFINYHRYVAVLKWLTLSLFAYVAALAFAHRCRGARRSPACWCRASPGARTIFTTIVAILGTTISPYLFFWQASQEAEEQRVDPDEAAADRAALRRAAGILIASVPTPSSAWRSPT